MSAATAQARSSTAVLEARERHSVHDKFSKKPSKMGVLVFVGVAIAGLIFIGTSIARDLSGVVMLSVWPYVLLGTALLVALGLSS
jgi:hypothetical protein